MRNFNQISILLFFLLLVCNCLKAQEYLITVSNDTIMCRIIDTTEDSIFYKTFENNKWIYSAIAKNQVIEKKKSLKAIKIRPIALYAELGGNGFLSSVNLDVNFVVENKLKVFGRIGYGDIMGMWGGWATDYLFEGGILLGEYHNLEVGLGCAPNNYPLSLRIGFRYLGPHGFVFRIAPLIITDYSKYFFWGGISFGYSLGRNNMINAWNKIF